MQAKVGSFAAPTATGTQATTGVGFSPDVIFFFCTDNTADGTTGGMGFCFGATMGANQSRVSGMRSDDLVTTSNTLQWSGGSDAIFLRDGNAGNILLADISTLDADGFTLDWSVVDAGTQRIVCYLALGGLAATYIGSTTSPTSTGNVSVTGLTQPDGVIMWNTLVSGDNAQMYIGAYAVSGGSNCVAFRSTDAQGTSSTRRTYDTTNIVSQISATAASVLIGATLSSLNSDGFTLNWTPVDSSGYGNNYLAFRGARFRVAKIDQKVTPTGTLATTGLGFKPKALILISNNFTATGITTHARMSVGFASSTSERACTWMGDANASALMVVKSDLDRTKCIKMMTEGAVSTSTDASADLSSFDSDGFTLNWNPTDGTSRDLIYMAFGDMPVIEASEAITVVDGCPD